MQSFKDILRGLSGPAPVKPFEVTLYLTEDGPVEYDAQVFAVPDPRVTLPQELLQSGLAWYWESTRVSPPVEAETDEGTALPADRPLTLLTPANAASLRADVQERDSHGFLRDIVLIGLDADVATDPVDRDLLRDAFREFLDREAGPIRVAIAQEYDMGWAYVYVPHQPITSVAKLLITWGITESTVRRVRRIRGRIGPDLLNLLFPLPGSK